MRCTESATWSARRAMPKPSSDEPEMPTTRPRASTNAPPLCPPAMVASVCRYVMPRSGTWRMRDSRPSVMVGTGFESVSSG